MNLQLIIHLSVLLYSIGVESSFIINKNDDNRCNLDLNLIQEIASYQNDVRKIINEIIYNGYGEDMYNEYTDFIDKFGARASGTENLENSIDHMINLTHVNGVFDVTTEEVNAPHWVRGQEFAKMIKPYERPIKILGLGTSVSTPLDGITAEAVVIKSFDELDRTDEDKIKGKIVVFDAHFITYGETVKYRSQGASKAAQKGAVATLIRSITPFSIYSPHTGAQDYENNVTEIPTAAITLEDADMLRRIQERKSDDQQIRLHIKMINSFDMKKSRNTLIDLKGTEYPEKQVIVSGHIDSWDVGTGAMDDGGGMIISWFVPIILNKLSFLPRRTVRAILWTSEEPGLIGAQAYLNKHVQELDNINIIMESDEGTFKPLGLEVSGTNTTCCIIKEVLKLFQPIDKFKQSQYPGSDITIFMPRGVPGASLLNENERYYWYHHSDGDTLNVQNKPDVIECAAFWAAVSYVLADLSVDLPRK